MLDFRARKRSAALPSEQGVQVKYMHNIVGLGFIAMASFSGPSHATPDTKNVYLSQCDGCTQRQAQQKILNENGVGLEQRWFSIDGINQKVLAFNVNYFPDNGGGIYPTQRRGNEWYYLEPIANDGRANALTQPLLAFYNIAPVGWVKTIGPGPDSLSAKILNPRGLGLNAIKPMADSSSPRLPPYPDPAFNVWNTVDAGSTSHNVIVNYVQNSTMGNIQSIASRLTSMFAGKAEIETKGGSVSVTPSFQANLYVVVQFMDGSKLSLMYTPDGWVTDPRFGQTTDSNGNSVPITADQIAPPNGIHVYDFRAKSWTTNSSDQSNWSQRVGMLTGGSAIIAPSTLIIGCTTVDGGPVSCRSFITN